VRTRDEKIIGQVYLKENVEKPLYMWLSERLGKNLPQDEGQRPYLLKLLKTLIKDEQSALKGRKKTLPKVPLTRPVSTASVDISPDSFPKSTLKKESKTLRQAYQNMYLKEEEDPSEYQSKYYDDSYKNYDGLKDDFRVVYQDQEYSVDIAYDIEEIYHEGDNVTPPDWDYDVKEVSVVSVFYNDPESGESVEIKKENNPELWDAVSKKAENDFLSDSSNWNPYV
jgi:hypothetical protein